MKLFQIDVGYACFGIVSDGTQIIEAAPIAGWSISKSEDYVLNYFKTRKRAKINVIFIMENDDLKKRMLETPPDINIRSATISYGFDTHKSGSRQHHFISMNVDLVDPSRTEAAPSLEDAHLLILSASSNVTKIAIDTALARGQLTIQEANELLQTSQDNHKLILEKRESQFKENV